MDKISWYIKKNSWNDNSIVYEMHLKKEILNCKMLNDPELLFQFIIKFSWRILHHCIQCLLLIVFPFPRDIVGSCKPLKQLSIFSHLLAMYTSVPTLINDILVLSDIWVLYNTYFPHTSYFAKGKQFKSQYLRFYEVIEC